MQKTFRFFKWSGKKAVAFLCISVALTAAVVGATLAFLETRTEPLNVEFQPSTVSVDKSTDGKGVVNKGDVDVYVRVAVICTWKSTAEENNIMSLAPVSGVNYNLTVAEGWVKAADGFWYCLNPISPGETCKAISSVEPIGNAPSGHKLSVELLADAIQAYPTDAVKDSWKSGVTSVGENGTLVIKLN